jgi:hypothetical protein
MLLRFMTLALVVLSVFERVLQMFLKWLPGMGVKLGKLLLLHVQKIVLGARDVKQPVQRTF